MELNSRLFSLPLAPVVAIVALGLVGCGSTTDTVGPRVSPAGSGGDPPSGLATECPDDHNGDWSPGPDGVTDYADFVQVGDRQYVAENQNDGVLEPMALGDTVAVVCFQLGEMTFTGPYDIQPGDAAFLAPGTELRAFEGADPELRLAAEVDDRVEIYEVYHVDGAETGAQVLDLNGVEKVTVNDEEDGATQLAVIDDPAMVAALVDGLAGSTVDVPGDPERDLDGPRYFLELHRADGTTTRRAYWQETGELFPGVLLNEAGRAVIDQSLEG